MKQSILLVLLVCATSLFAQDKSQITVKDSSTGSGVVLVTIHESGKTFELQCTESAPHCAAPQAGTYWMVRLPKNHGLYDCANVDLYRQAADPDSQGEMIGEYCLNEK
jgi:hypothetical protein